MAVVTRSIGTTSRDYATISAWEADLDDTGIYSAGDDAVGEMYDDSAFDEDVVINGGGTVGLASITLQAATGEGHDGTAGTGARIVRSSAGNIYIFEINTSVAVEINDFEIDANDINIAGGGTESNALVITANGATSYIRRCLIHNLKETSANATTTLVERNSNGDFAFLNNILYRVEKTSGGRDAIGYSEETGNIRDLWAYNNTVFKVIGNDAGGNNNAWKFNTSNGTQKHLKNCIGLDSTDANFVFGGSTDPDVENCMSDDATADDAGGTGHQINVTISGQFVSTTAGSEDLHLVSGSDAVDTGTDLGVTISGAEIDIDGRDRDAQGDTWDIGADEFVSAGGATLEGALTLSSSYALASSVLATLEASTSLAHSQSVTTTAAGTFEASLTLTQAQQAATSADATLGASASLAHAQQLSATSTVSIEGAVTLGLNAQVTTSALAALEAATTLAQTTGLTPQAVADMQAALSLAQSAGIATAGGSDISAALSLAMTQTQATGADISIDGAVSLGLDASVAAQAQADLEASSALGLTAALSMIADAVYEAGLTLDAVQSVTTDGNVVIAGLTAPDGRTFTVTARTRVYSAGSRSRDFGVTSRSRTFTVN